MYNHSEKTKVFVVDDHPIILEMFKSFLREVPQLEISGLFESAEDAIPLINNIKPSLVVMDLHLPGMGGLKAAQEILKQDPSVKILIMSGQGDEKLLPSVLRSGAKGYISKGHGVDELRNAIDLVMAGKTYIDKKFQENKVDVLELVNSFPFDKISKQECEVLKYISEGFSLQSISERLSVKPRTVRFHRDSLLRKLNAKNDVQLIKLAAKYGVFQ